VGEELDRAVSAKRERAMTMTVRIFLYCLLGGLSLTIAAAGAGHFGWWWLSGVVLSAAFVPVVRFGPRSWPARFATILPPLFVVGTLCTQWEVAIFFPGLRGVAGRDLAAGLVMDLIVAVVLGLLLPKVLKLTDLSDSLPEMWSPWITAGMVLLSGVAYVIYYLIFGWITYGIFTKQYYPEAESIARSLGLRLWLMELARGILMTLSVLPAIFALRMRRWHAAIAVGVLLWVVGGVSPLLVPNALMVPAQRYIHIVEILTQNAALGITAVLLLRPRNRSSMGAIADGSRSTASLSR
jgi:type IV secretory pathway TrbD component